MKYRKKVHIINAIQQIFLLLFMVMLLSLSFSCKTGSSSQKATVPDDGEQDVTSIQMALSARYIDASKEKILGNFEAAQSAFRECIKIDPKHHPSYFQLADIGHITGNYQDGLYWIEKAVKLDDSNVWYKVLYGDVLLKLGRYREAERIYQEINKLRPGKRIWFEAKAHAQLMGGNPKAAAETYSMILENFDFDDRIFFRMVEIYEKQGDLRRMEQSLVWLVGKYPFETKYLGILAAFYQSRNQSAKALPLWQEILRLEPGNGEVRFDLANYYRSRGDEKQAFAELYEAFKTPNLSIDAKIAVMLSYYNLTEKHPELLPEAYSLLEVMVDRHPENPKGWSMYGDYLFRDKRYPETLEKMQNVVALDSSRYLVWEQLLQCAAILNDFTSLNLDGAKALRIFPDQALIYLYHGTGLLYSNSIDAAITMLNRGYLFTGFNDSLASAFLHLIARSYEEKNDLQRAEEYYRRALKRGSVSGSLLADYMRFHALYRNGEIDDDVLKLLNTSSESNPMVAVCLLWRDLIMDNTGNTVSDVNKLADLHKDNYLVLEHAGNLLYALGHKERSSIVWSEALKLSNGNILIRSKIEKHNK